MSIIHDIRKYEGLCVYCAKPMDREGKFCIECNDRWNEWSAERKHNLNAEGKCAKCSKPLERKGWICIACTETHKADAKRRRDYRRDNRLCIQCGEPLIEKYTRCRKCLDKLEIYRLKKKQGVNDV